MSDLKLRWYTLVVDCGDVRAQSQWWADVLDWQRVHESDDECVIVPKHISLDPVAGADWHKQSPGMVFVPVPEGKSVKNRLHIDLAPHADDDRGAQLERLLGMGATRVDVGQVEDETFTVLADPEGNEFCLLSARDR